MRYRFGTRARNTGKLERLWTSRTEVRRGEKIEVQAFARTENGGEYVERIPLEIPKDAPLGQFRVDAPEGAVGLAALPSCVALGPVQTPRSRYDLSVRNAACDSSAARRRSIP